MSDKRETIFENIAETLQTITVANGYSQTVRGVYRNFFMPHQAPEYPCLLVFPGPSPVRHLTNLEFESEMGFNILGYLRVEEDISNAGILSMALEGFIKDIIKAMYVDIRRDNPGFVDYTHITEIDPYYDWDHRIGIAGISGHVLYTSTFLDP